MSRGMPSMTALLALLAVAGYQNREKIGQLIRNAGQPTTNFQTADSNYHGGSTSTMNDPQTNSPSILSEIGALFTGSTGGQTLADSIGQLVDKFRTAGQARAVDSWVAPGQNQALPSDQVAQALGESTVEDLSRKTGLTRAEVLNRLARSIPEIVDTMTPNGHLPQPHEAQNFI
ncbi:MAG: YidB family protein [bacterium]